MTYDLKPMKAPRAAGNMLRAFVAMLESSATGGLIADKLLKDAGITGLRDLPTHTPLDPRLPVFKHGRPPADPGAKQDLEAVLRALPAPPRSAYETVADFAAAYREGKSTPSDVAERAVAIHRESDALSPPMRTLIAQERDDVLRQAQASTERYRRGQPLGPLDGVPVAVKDELDQAGYRTTVGTRFLGTAPAAADAEVVRRLRVQGALLVGKANMHEIGMGVTGLNPHHGSARNAYDPAHATGGSSSGSAAAVAMGLCPIAVGADGGGSIRIPAGFCGQVGLKATFGRLSEHGAAELCWTVAHVGPIASSVRDCALAYAVMAGADDKDPQSMLAPAVDLDGLGEARLDGVRIGIYRPWFEDADGEVVERAQSGVEHLKRAGAEVRDVTIPELEVMRVAHLVSIVAEMTAAHLQHYRDHRTDYGLEVRLSLALGRRLQAYDYVHAQRHRARVWEHLARALEQVDVIATPTTGCTAPVLPPDALSSGESNLELYGKIMRFATVANLTGLPAISVPCGYDGASLPVGLQLMGRPWDEKLLLRMAAVVEKAVPKRTPRVHYRYL
jgi:Asp-tRNA(Asn)/Glu-tRNA(Gln) amidotransferase A subunit family amidase